MEDMILLTKCVCVCECVLSPRCSSLGSYTLYAGLANGQLASYDDYLIPVS